MRFLSSILSSQNFYTELRDHVSCGFLPVVVNGPSGIHKAHIASCLMRDLNIPAIFIAADEAEASRMAGDLQTFGLRCKIYPARDLSFRPMEGMSHEFEHQRIEALCAMMSGECDVIVTVADAAQQLTVPPEQLRERTATLAAGEQISLDGIISALTEGGYERAVTVEGAGQFSVRGGIIDFFPPTSPAPIRAELWGDEIDTLSYFDVQTQRRTDPIDSVSVYPAAELTCGDPATLADLISDTAANLRGAGSVKARELLYSQAEAIRAGIRPASLDQFISLLCSREATVFDYLPEGGVVFVSEHTAVRQRAKEYEARMNEEIKALIEDGVLCRRFCRFTLSESELYDHFGRAIYMDTFAHGSFATPIKEIFSVEARQLPAWDGTVSILIEDIAPLLDSGCAVAILAGSARACDALASDLTAAGIKAIRANDPESLTPGEAMVAQGCISSGFEYPGAKAAVMTYGHAVRASSRRRPAAKHKKGAEIQSLSELSPGDYVVHLTHGIGIFGGIVKIATEGVTRDYIKITYDRGEVIYVPVTQLDMVSKYIGSSEDGRIKLSSIGGGDWNRRKSRVRKAVKDIAKQLIRLYAERMQAEGWPFDPDTEMQRDFEARFEYDETEDQLRCIREIKADMERAVPMERLLCGDVGFGKTEVALRAAFKCLVEGRQCALLAPTTILAWQHWQTAIRRFEGYGFRIELLSRFRTPKQQQEILRDLKKGRVHMLIGTHRIIQKDVEFHDLGLAIIDEEQRFGVAHKERFKEAFHSVDILTLSATPIPRTLNMALSGLRDISVLEEAPQDRLPVQTYVIEYDAGVVADAIRRELRRGGQVYYLHNRVGDIDKVAARLHEMVPDAAIGVAHGQMTEQQISREWKRLIDHEIDILLCTTIIEAGVDVANANTLIIENAENFGLSQLHQIRGRVGRSSRRAYAYLTFNGRKELTEIAAKRLQAIREFTEFGSGMKIAMRDLELRGAGNVLGGEQSGHLDMVGYDLYMKLLSEAVAEEKGEKPQKTIDCTIDLPIEAHIPESYIGDTVLRLDVYRMIADIRSDEDSSEVIDELIDRFGDPPAAVMGLIKVALARNRAAALGMTEIKHTKNDSGQVNIMFFFEEADMERVVRFVSAAAPRRAMFTPGAKPYLTVPLGKKTAMIDDITNLLAAFDSAVSSDDSGK